MDVILLEFCLVSMSITICLVLLELARNKKIKITLSEEVIPDLQYQEFNEVKYITEEDEDQPLAPQADFLRLRIETALENQLCQLGYTSTDDQLNFINGLLQEEKQSLSSLNSTELRSVLNGIISQEDSSESRSNVQSG